MPLAGLPAGCLGLCLFDTPNGKTLQGSPGTKYAALSLPEIEISLPVSISARLADPQDNACKMSICLKELGVYYACGNNDNVSG